MRKITRTKTQKFIRYYLGFLINRFVIDIAPRILLSFELFKSINKEDLNDEHLEITVRLMSNESVIVEKSQLLFNKNELVLSRFETGDFHYTFQAKVPDRLNVMPTDSYTSHTKSELHKFFYYKISGESIYSLIHDEKLYFRFYTGKKWYRYNFTSLADSQLKQMIHIFQFNEPSPILVNKIRQAKLLKRAVQFLILISITGVSYYIFSHLEYLEVLINRDDISDDKIAVVGLLFIVLSGLITALFRKKIFH